MKKLLLILLCVPLIGLTQITSSPLSTNNSINWLELAEAEILSEQSNKNMLLFFYRENCDFCEKMKSQTFTDSTVINLINENFFPVMLNGKTKKSITYNGKKYVNDAPIEEDPNSTWRHNLFFELVEPTGGNFYWPTIVIIDGNDKKVGQLPGFKTKQQLLRSLNKLK